MKFDNWISRHKEKQQKYYGKRLFESENQSIWSQIGIITYLQLVFRSTVGVFKTMPELFSRETEPVKAGIFCPYG